MTLTKTIFLILAMISVAICVGIGAASAFGAGLHAKDALLAGAIGLVAATVALLPMQFRSDRSVIALFQSAWIGSVVHMALAAGLGMAAIYLLKLATPFVIWLLAMYWISLGGLCASFIKTMRQAAPPASPC